MNIIIMGGIFIEKKFFRDWVEEYQQSQNKSEVLGRFLIFYSDKWRTRDYLFNQFLDRIMGMYSNLLGQDEAFDIALFSFCECLERIDLSKYDNNKSVLDYFQKHIKYRLNDEAMKVGGQSKVFKDGKKNYQKQIEIEPITEIVDETDGDVIFSNIDWRQVQEFMEGSTESTKERRFWEAIKKYAKDLLGPKQYSIFEAIINAGQKQENEIAQNLNMTAKNYYALRDSIVKKIQGLWEEYLSIEEKLRTDRLKKIMQFLQEVAKIYEVSKLNFDYFSYLVNFLKENYRQGEQWISFSWLQRNKNTLHETIFDVLVDRIPKNDYFVLHSILEKSQNPNLSDNRKMEIFANCFQAFLQFIQNISNNLQQMQEYLFEGHIQNMENSPFVQMINKKYIGVSRRSNGTYLASIRNGNKHEYIGIFSSPLEAARAYDRRAKELGKTKLNNV
jgi:flagellar motility protein MotE (MotC chaperone)